MAVTNRVRSKNHIKDKVRIKIPKIDTKIETGQVTPTVIYIITLETEDKEEFTVKPLSFKLLREKTPIRDIPGKQPKE